MLSKPATVLLGIIYDKPINAYEIIKMLEYMNVKWWFNIADSTVYATLKTLCKKNYIVGNIEKNGNMPQKKVYNITDEGTGKLKETLRKSILTFDYDTNVFSIAAFFMNILSKDEQISLLNERLEILNKYKDGITSQMSVKWKNEVSDIHIVNVERMKALVDAEIFGAKKLLECFK